MSRFIRSVLAATAIALALPATSQAQEKLQVVATFSIIADFASQVGGDRIELTTIVGPDGDAHAYEPRPQDAALLSKADVILANGAHFEGFLDRLVKSSGAKSSVTELVKGVKLLEAPGGDAHDHDAHDAAHKDHAHEDGHAHEGDHEHEKAEAGHHDHDHGPEDPHAFQSAANAAIYVANIAEAFCAADAAGCETYRANGANYSAELSKLDSDLKALASSLPADKRTIISSHDAFRYFADAYGIRFLAAEGLTTEADPSAANIARLVDQARDGKAAAIFVENITDPRLAEQISRETGLPLGGTLYSDALTGPDGAAPTYLDMMRANMDTIVGAVRGS